MTMERTLEQQRAKVAWECVADFDQKVANKEIKKKYRSLARNLPALILGSGLGPTLAFLRSKGSESWKEPNGGAKEHDWICYHLNRWLTQWMKKWRNQEEEDILHWIVTKSDSTNYRYVTNEALAFAQWLKRFAEAELPEEEGGS